MKSRRDKVDIDKEKAVEKFGNEAEKPKLKVSPKAEPYRRFTFSLTEGVSQKIDDLSLVTTRISRSDVIKAGILVLSGMPEEKLKEILVETKAKVNEK